MQEKWQRMKIPPPWKPDEWVCHHSGNRRSAIMDNYDCYSSDRKSVGTSRNFNSPTSSHRVSTAKLRRQIENLSLKSAEYRRSARQSKIKRLNDTLSRKSYKSILSYASHRPITPLRIPKMSKQSLKRWLDARDAYLGHNYPYIQERLGRHRRLRRRRKTKSTNEDDKMIDYECAASIFSIDSDQLSVPELISKGQQRRLSRKDSRTKPISHSETNIRRKVGLFERIKSFVQSPVRSLSRLSLRKQQPQKKTQIVHDHFDDKCVGTEISEQKIVRTNIERKDQATQANIPRPKIKLHHEFDTSMVVGEKKQRIRSVRREDVEYRDKATETDFLLNFAIVDKERREEEKEKNEVDDDDDVDDKATRRGIKKEKIDPYQEQYNVEQEQHQLPSMSTSAHRKKRKTESQQPQNLTNTGNRIVPLTDLLQTSTNETNNKENGSRLTILTSTESNASTHEQLLRLRIRFNRLSKERRLLTCLLILFAIIMCGLLIGIFILSWAFQGRTPIIYREINSTNIGTSDGALQENERQILTSIADISTSIVHTTLSTTTIPSTTTTEKQLARYGESCDNDSGCERPFICHKKGSSTPGMCRCPLKYDFVKDQCVGDLNALCTKDSDCQHYMICSGMNDGTRRCQCQTQFNYDNERRRCRGEYKAPCESSFDCRANLICNKTTSPSFCSCEAHYQYHPSLRKCRGDPGAVCDRATAECVDNAECRDGACECSNQFVPDDNKICVDPCPVRIPNPPRIRYPGNCQRFIDCQQKSKTECPEMTLFNLRTQLCDYPKNVFDCR